MGFERFRRNSGPASQTGQPVQPVEATSQGPGYVSRRRNVKKLDRNTGPHRRAVQVVVDL